MNDRLRETDAALVTWLRDLEAQAQRLAECDGDLADLASVKAFKACADLIERQGNAIEDLELRLHQTNDAHALSCSEHLKALTEIERQGKALRAVEALCDEADAYYRQEFTGMVLTKEIRAALAQTEPQASSFDGGSPQLSQPKAIEKLRLRLSRLALGDPPIYRIVLSRVEMRLLRGAIATPSPTIAADDGECDECERKELQISAMLQAAYRAQLDGNPLGASQAVIEAYRHANDEDDEDCVWCRSDNVDNLRKRIADLEAPTIAAPSPSNEVTPEKVEAGDSRDKLYDTIEKWRAHFDGFSQDPSRGNDDYYAGMASGLTIALQEIDRARYDGEAALKARKPADDGAGQ